jgi:hypothetical protein
MLLRLTEDALKMDSASYGRYSSDLNRNSVHGNGIMNHSGQIPGTL